MLDALESYSPTHAEFELRKLPIREVRSGMILDEDVLSKDGKLLILKAGTLLTETWIERLENFAKVRGIEMARVRIPRVVCLGKSPVPAPIHGVSATEVENA